MKKLTDEMIINFFPSLKEVQNEEWIRIACEIWKEAFNNSSWEKVEDAQFATRAKNVPLVKHTNSVVENSLTIAKRTQQVYGFDLDLDLIIVAGVLHDVCKLEEMQMGAEGAGSSEKSDTGKIFQHGFLSGYYTQKYNLPKEITAFMVSHAGQSKLIPKTKEELILFYCDVMDADLHFLNAEVPLTLEVD